MNVHSDSDQELMQRETADEQATTEDEQPEEEQAEVVQAKDEPPEEEQAVANRISKDDAFHMLQNPRRRAVLRFLAAHENQARFEMRDIAEEVAAWEHDTTVRKLASDERQRVYIALYQSHLPKLDKHDIIDYNQSRGIIEVTELTQVLDPYIDTGLNSTSKCTVQDRDDDGQESGLKSVVSTLFDH